LFMFMDRFHKKRSSGIGSWFVIGLGTLVTLLGFSMRNKNEKLHAGITGFGLAHILLGALDMLRNAAKE
jgi:hypothetical protein